MNIKPQPQNTLQVSPLVLLGKSPPQVEPRLNNACIAQSPFSGAEQDAAPHFQLHVVPLPETVGVLLSAHNPLVGALYEGTPLAGPQPLQPVPE